MPTPTRSNTRSFRRRGRWSTYGVVTLALVTALGVSGCGGSDDHQAKGTGNVHAEKPTGPVKATVNWDLSKGHTAAQVKWKGKDAFELDGGVRVKVKLPEGKTLDERVQRFGAERNGDNIRNLRLFYPASSVAEAYAQAKRLGSDWHVNMRHFDAWYKRQKEHPSRPDDIPDVSTGGQDSKAIGDGGPVPIIETSYSFDKSKPVLLQFQLFWMPKD